MAKRTERTLVFRAEFENRIFASFGGGSRVMTGKFVVEVRRLRDSRSWGAMVNGDAGDMLAAAPTASGAMQRTRRHFEKPLCDWVVGHKPDGQWRPIEEVTLGLKGGAA